MVFQGAAWLPACRDNKQSACVRSVEQTRAYPVEHREHSIRI